MEKADQLLNSKNLQTLFGASHMSIYTWRNQQSDPLPTEHDGNKVGFSPAKVKAWAKRQGRAMTVTDPATLVGTATAPKPGPKAKIGAVKTDTKKTAKPVAKKTAAKAPAKAPAKKTTPLKGASVKEAAKPVAKAANPRRVAVAEPEAVAA